MAEGLLRAGASVTITSRKGEACQTASEELSAIGPCRGIAADFSQPEAVESLADEYRKLGDGLDILVNNSGRTWAAPIETFPDKAWGSIMAINVFTPFKLVQTFLAELEAGASGDDPARIINIGSIAGRIVEPLRAYSYSASKAAIHHLTRQLAADLADRHITVNTLVPGYFPTSMTAHLRSEDGAPSGMLEGHIPLGRFGRATDISGALLFLSSRAGSYVTGAEVVVDGGISGCR